VRDDDDRAPLPVEPLHERHGFTDLAVVEAGGRLVENEGFGARGQHRGHGDALALALGEEEGVGRPFPEQSDRDEGFLDAFPDGGGVEALESGPKAISASTVSAKIWWSGF